MIPAGVEGYHIGNRYRPRRHRRPTVLWTVLRATGIATMLGAFLLLDFWLVGVATR